MIFDGYLSIDVFALEMLLKKALNVCIYIFFSEEPSF